MDESKPEIDSVHRAHDQETQTTFDVNHREPTNNRTTSIESRRPHGYPPYNHRHTQSWSAGHPYHAAPYPEYYPYDMHYPPPHHPPPSMPAPPHANHYYPGRTPHWHSHPPSPVLPSHLSPIPHPHSPYRPYHYHHPDAFYPNPPSMHGVAPPLSSSRERRHTDSDIARPKAEWPPGYQPFVKPVIPSDYLANLHRNPASEYGGPPSTAASLRSTVIDLPHSSFPSPRLSAKLSRKRAHSNTPSSVESIDLNALIRGSPDSLSGYLGPARVSSAGSFGHLSPIGFCTSPGSHQASCYPVARTVFITPPPIATPRIPTPSSTSRDALPSSTTGAEGTKEEMSESMSCAESSQVSRAKEPQGTSCKEESMDVCPLDSTTSPGASEVKVGYSLVLMLIIISFYTTAGQCNLLPGSPLS